jgi:hypothetical protein
MAIIDKPSDYFNTKLYTGTGSSLANTGVGFQPDLVWIKGRSGATEHVLTDSVRGVTKELSSNDTGAEETVAQGLTAFNSDGFTVGTDGSYNTSSATYASWNWKAGGTASSNTDGSITSSVSANTTSGFSIVSYSGTSGNGTIGHGLDSAPKMVIVKALASGRDWMTYHKSVGATKYLFLNATDASASSSGIWNDTDPTSTVVHLGSSNSVNGTGINYIAYCFAEKQGYSKFGSYTGNGSTDGTFVYTGFKPAWVMVKKTNGATNWQLIDNKRSDAGGNNIIDKVLSPNATDADYDEGSVAWCGDLLSNGFKWRGNWGALNNSGDTYIYMAFAENPFVTSTGVPATAR